MGTATMLKVQTMSLGILNNVVPTLDISTQNNWTEERHQHRDSSHQTVTVVCYSEHNRALAATQTGRICIAL